MLQTTPQKEEEPPSSFNTYDLLSNPSSDMKSLKDCEINEEDLFELDLEIRHLQFDQQGESKEEEAKKEAQKEGKMRFEEVVVVKDKIVQKSPKIMKFQRIQGSYGNGLLEVNKKKRISQLSDTQAELLFQHRKSEMYKNLGNLSSKRPLLMERRGSQAHRRKRLSLQKPVGSFTKRSDLPKKLQSRKVNQFLISLANKQKMASFERKMKKPTKVPCVLKLRDQGYKTYHKKRSTSHYTSFRVSRRKNPRVKRDKLKKLKQMIKNSKKKHEILKRKSKERPKVTKKQKLYRQYIKKIKEKQSKVGKEQTNRTNRNNRSKTSRQPSKNPSKNPSTRKSFRRQNFQQRANKHYNSQKRGSISECVNDTLLILNNFKSAIHKSFHKNPYNFGPNKENANSNFEGKQGVWNSIHLRIRKHIKKKKGSTKQRKSCERISTRKKQQRKPSKKRKHGFIRKIR